MKKFIPILIIFLLCFSFFSINVYAEDETPIPRQCQLCGATHDMAEMPFASRIAFEWHESVFGGKIVDDSGGPASLFNVLKFDINGGVFKSIFDKTMGIYNTISVLGFILIVAYALTELSAHVTSVNLSPEILLKFLIKYLLGYIVMVNLPLFLDMILDLSSLIFTTVLTASETNFSFADMCVYDAYICHDMFDGFIEMAVLFIPYLIIMLARAVTSMYAWYRVLDLTARIMFSPIGAPDMLMNGTRGSGWRFMKGLFGSAMQGSVILAIFYTYSMIMNSLVTSSGVATWFIATVLSIVVIMSMFKANEITRSIIN